MKGCSVFGLFLASKACVFNGQQVALAGVGLGCLLLMCPLAQAAENEPAVTQAAAAAAAANRPAEAPARTEAAALEAFAPLLDGRELAAFKDLHIAALATAGQGAAMVVLNGRILHEGDMLGMARVACITSEALVLAFNNRHYVLHPRNEGALEPAKAQSPSRLSPEISPETSEKASKPASGQQRRKKGKR